MPPVSRSVVRSPPGKPLTRYGQRIPTPRTAARDDDTAQTLAEQKAQLAAAYPEFAIKATMAGTADQADEPFEGILA